MTKRALSPVMLFIVSVIATALIPGCGESGGDPLPPVSIVVPDSLTQNGSTWTKSTMAATDETLLSKFFELNQQLVGSADMEGAPQMFTSGNDRLFYWVRPAADGARWSCVRFTKGEFSHAEGTGNPY